MHRTKPRRASMANHAMANSHLEKFQRIERPVILLRAQDRRPYRLSRRLWAPPSPSRHLLQQMQSSKSNEWCRLKQNLLHLRAMIPNLTSLPRPQWTPEVMTMPHLTRRRHIPRLSQHNSESCLKEETHLPSLPTRGYQAGRARLAEGASYRRNRGMMSSSQASLRQHLLQQQASIPQLLIQLRMATETLQSK